MKNSKSADSLKQIIKHSYLLYMGPNLCHVMQWCTDCLCDVNCNNLYGLLQLPLEKLHKGKVFTFHLVTVWCNKSRYFNLTF